MIIVPVLAVDPYQGMTKIQSSDGEYTMYVSNSDAVVHQIVTIPPSEGILVNSYPGNATYFFKADNGTDYIMQYTYGNTHQNVGLIQEIINAIEGVV
jgi:hypothetical protein